MTSPAQRSETRHVKTAAALFMRSLLQSKFGGEVGFGGRSFGLEGGDFHEVVLEHLRDFLGEGGEIFDGLLLEEESEEDVGAGAAGLIASAGSAGFGASRSAFRGQ